MSVLLQVEHIEKALQDGKQVIFWTQGKATFADNPFSFGDHYIMAKARAKAQKGSTIHD